MARPFQAPGRLGVAAVLCALVALSSAARADRTQRVRLRTDRLEDAWLVPQAAELQVSGPPAQLGTSPARARLGALLDGRVGAPNAAGRLPVDPAGTGSQTWLSARKDHVVTLRAGADTYPILFFRKQDLWYAASASIVRARLGKRTIHLYDADLDGTFLSPRDYLRVQPDAFRPVAGEPLVLLGEEHRLVGLDASGTRLVATGVPRPEWANDRQWASLLTLNRFRGAAGLPLMRLDERMAEGCQKHAVYLKLNKDAPETPLDVSHDEIEGNPGYSKVGREAARSGGIHYLTDPSEAILDLLKTLLHRSNFVGAAKPGFGSGVAEGSLHGGVPGYTVLWGTDPEVPPDGMPVVVPGPGQCGFPKQGEAEIPDVEKHPGLFDVPRGNPIAIYCGQLPLSDLRVTVFQCRGRKRTPVPGLLFTPEDPVASIRPHNDGAAFFVAEAAFESEARYEVRFTGEHEDPEGAKRRVRLAWTFETAKR